jgi:hypothetical protein
MLLLLGNPRYHFTYASSFICYQATDYYIILFLYMYINHSNSILKVYEVPVDNKSLSKWVRRVLNKAQLLSTIALLEEQCYTSNNAHFELCPQEVRLRPYTPSGIVLHVYFIKWPQEGRSVVFRLMRLHRPDQWVFLCPENLYFRVVTVVL